MTYMLDPIERGEARCERWASERVTGDVFLCGCGVECPLDAGETLSPDPYAIPICPGCMDLECARLKRQNR